ncbi:MAG: hypothetical protein ACM3VW_01385, partial [Bacteroidota bacterium]
MSAALTIIRKELRATIPAPLALLACLALVTFILHLQHFWSVRIISWYTIAVALLGLYMGAEAVSGEAGTRYLQWQSQWPISRAKWWLLKLLLQATLTFLCGGLAYAMLAWLSAHHGGGQEAVRTGVFSVWAGGLAIIPVFIVAFFASSIGRTSVQAFFLAIGLSWGLAVIQSIPMMAHLLSAFRLGRVPSPPTPALYIVPWAFACLALLLGSLYGFISTPPLEYGKQAGRAFGVLLALVIPATLMMSAYGLYSGARGAGHALPFARGGPSSVPSGISAASISPDGRRIAFTDDVFDQTLWVMNADGSNLRQIVTERVEDFVWLGDSRRIVAATQVRQPSQSTGQGRMTQTQASQWSVFDSEAQRPKPVPILQTTHSGSRMSRLSPRGKYLWLDGHFVEVDTWKSAGQVKVPNYSPWFLTWLPNDSAIYVYEHRYQGGFRPPGASPAPAEKPTGSPLRRISVPSGEMTDAQIPQQAVSNRPYDTDEINPLSERTDWCSADRSTYVNVPFDQQPVIYRSTYVRGLDNTEGRRTFAEPVAHRRQPRTLLYQLRGTRKFELAGLQPCRGGMSPSGRYCLFSVVNGVTESDDRADWYAAVVDMATGKVTQRVRIPGLTSLDRSEGEIQWSRDEQWVAQVVERWGDTPRSTELLLGSVRGDSKKLNLGDVDGWGASGVVGWTATGKFVVIRKQSALVAIGVDGQEQVLVQSTQPWYEKASEHSPQKATVPAGTPSSTPAGPTGGPAAPGAPAASAPLPHSPEKVGTDSNYTEPTPKDFIAAVLGVKPGQVAGVTLVVPKEYYSSTRGFDWEGRVDGRTIHVTSSGPGQWSLRKDKTAAPKVSGTVTIDQARATAANVLQRRFHDDVARLAETSAVDLGTRGFMFGWSEAREEGVPGDSAQLTLDAAGKVKSYNEHRVTPAVTETPAPTATEIQETPAHFAAVILGVPESEIPAPTNSGSSWWEYQIRGRTYHVEHPPFRWGLQLWSDYKPGKTITAAKAAGIAKGLVNQRLGQNVAPGGTLTWKAGTIARFSFDCKETLGPNLFTGDKASVVLFPDGALMTYEERRVLPKLGLNSLKIKQAKARQMADDLVRWGQSAEHTRYTFKRMWLDMRGDPFNDAGFAPVWSIEYKPAGTIEDWRRVRP